MIGQRIKQYEIVEEIGTGGMATVYRAYQPSADRFVAIKVIHQNIARDDNVVERFMREARLVAHMEHPHILPVYDYDAQHDPPFIVMRYLESGTLKDVIDQRTLPLSEVAYMMRQIAAALDYAHRQGVIHRDIKPSNIMVDQEGNAFLTDFGIARVTDAPEGLTQTGIAVGTPGFMAPEQSVGDAITQQVDVYALGVMLFQMLTGRMPYSSDTPMGLLLKHIQDPIPSAMAINEELPPEIDTIMLKAMAKQPEDRYATAGELSDALTEAAGLVEATRAPSALRAAAQEVIARIQDERGDRMTEIDQTMATFAAQRGGASTMPGMVPDGPTIATPTGQPSVAVPGLPGGRFPVAWIAGGIVGIVLVGLVAIFALGGGGGDDGTPTPGATDLTAIAAGAGASDTPRASATVTDTEAPTVTPTNTATRTPTDTPRPTPATPVVEARRELAIRLGPGVQYPVVDNLPAGDQLDIVGINEEGTWYQVLLPDGTRGWLLASRTLADVAGDQSVVRIAEPPTATPSYTPTNTSTATTSPTITDTPTRTASPTSTPSATPTDTATATATASDTPTATSTPSDTPTATATATDTPTITPTPSDTATFTASPTATATDTPTVTPLPTETELPTRTPIPTPTEIPAGRLPYVGDFEEANPISGWDYDATAWQVVNEGGQNVLIGQGSLQQPAVVLGGERPEWLDASASDFVITFSFNLDPQSGGARIVYRYEEGVGYNVLEVFPGLMLLKRNAPTPNVFDRTTERLIRQNNGVSIRANEWHNVTIWVEGSRTFVYLDRALVIRSEDLILPQLGSGQILLQVNNTFRPVRFDDVVIQRAEPLSDHFESSSLPGTWRTTSTTNTRIEVEGDGNQYVIMEDPAELAPVMSPVADFTLSCRIWSQNAGYQLYLRESAGGGMLFDFDAGHLNIIHYDGGGNTVATYNINNFYTRGLWQDMDITFNGDRMEIYLDGRSRFEDTLQLMPPGGTLRFVTSTADIVRIDDCLLTAAAASANAGAAFAFALQEEVLARDFLWLRSDLDENFTNAVQTEDWWLGGRSADGDYLTDAGAANNQNFLRMTYLGRPTWRLFRGIIGVEMFGAGNDARNYSDSTDLYVTSEVRFPDASVGTAYLGLRVQQTVTGADLQGYRLEVTRGADGSTTFVVRYVSSTLEEIYYEGPLPGFEGEYPEWIPLVAISYQDRLAFFANGRLIVAIDNAVELGGTVALGVYEGTTADFDTLIIRDTTPR